MTFTVLPVERVASVTLLYLWLAFCFLPLSLGLCMGFPGGSEGKESTCNTRGSDSVPGPGRSPGGGKAYPLQYSCLENPMDRGAWWATVPAFEKGQTQLSMCVSLSVKCLFKSFARSFPIGSFVFLIEVLCMLEL